MLYFLLGCRLQSELPNLVGNDHIFRNRYFPLLGFQFWKILATEVWGVKMNLRLCCKNFSECNKCQLLTTVICNTQSSCQQFPLRD